ncbi:hypothetical protein GE061_015252 [Apolygus lucorum]|uniref:Cilia- and flagella-associated protein 58 central coiled coil domain-containing protein n=1 Tax=Apolygus lucorum TaxID=248454 RepID=A0A8S9XPH8_APOLU|nr:hypothetical protein GE061_015252 [Apolygus lucorum]
MSSQLKLPVVSSTSRPSKSSLSREPSQIDPNEDVPKDSKRPSELAASREDFWTVLANEQDQITVDYEKAIHDLLSLDEPLPNVQSVVTRMHEQTQRFKMGIKRKEAEIKEKEEKIEKLTTTLGKYKNSITIDQKIALEQDLLNLQKRVDVSHIREQDLQETVDYLRKQVKTLEQTVEQKDVEAAELDADLELMGRTREGMQKEKEKMKKIMMQTEAMVSTANAEREEYARLYDTSKGIIEDLRRQFSEKIAEAEQLTQKASGSEQTINDLKKNHNEVANEYEALYEMYLDCFKQLTIHRDTNHELAAGIEELFKENEDYEENEKLLKRKLNIMKVRISANERRFAELSADYDDQIKMVEKLRNQLRKLNWLETHDLPGHVKGGNVKEDQRELGVDEAQCDELQKLTKEVHKYKEDIVKKSAAKAAKVVSQSNAKSKDPSKDAVKEQPKPRSSPVRDNKVTDMEIRTLDKLLREKEKKVTELNNTIDTLQAEKKLMAESMAKMIGLNSEIQSQLKSQTSALKAMDQFLTDARQELRDQRNLNDTFKREKRRLLVEKGRLQNRIDELMSLVHQYEEQLLLTRKEVLQKTTQLKKEKNNLEVVKAERNSQHAKWQETNSMLQDQKRISKIEATQIQQLKEEVVTRDKRLTKEQLALKKLSAKYNSTIIHESKLEKKVDELKAEASKFESLKKTYENAKKEDDRERQAIMNRQAKFQREMGVINTMLDRRLVELGLLYEKVDLMNNMLRQGEHQYKERTEDIRLLKLEVTRLRYQNQVLQATYKNMADLRHEIYHLNRDLATERQKCHALQEELETPINFHRWRVLEGTDPDKRNLIDKVQILQKKLLKEIENRALEKERFKDLEAVYTQMKKKLINLPGSDVVEELNGTKKALKDKTDENRIFAATLSAYEGEIQDYKYRIEKLQKQYDELRTKFFNEKRIQDREKMRRFEARQASQPQVSEGKAALGGGFRLEEAVAVT